jgi:hypothetical protein
MRDERDELTREEREAFARLDRTLQVGRDEEERTVRRLRMEGLLALGASGEGRGGRERAESGGEGRGELGGRHWRRVVRVGLAVAAGVACYFAGLWSERAGVWAHRGAAPTDTLAMATPIIRF